MCVYFICRILADDLVAFIQLAWTFCAGSDTMVALHVQNADTIVFSIK